MVVIVLVLVIVVVEGPRKRFESDKLGKRQIGVSGVEGERVWKRAGGSAAAGCWGHFFSFWFFLGMDFWEGLGVFCFCYFLSLFGWVLVDAVNIDVCGCCCLYWVTFSFRL